MKHLYIILFVLPLIGFGQGWEQFYGSEIDYEMGFSVQQTLDGGYIIGGRSEEGSEGWDVLVIKTDEDGNEEWTQIFQGDGQSTDNCFDIKQTTDGGYIITGSTWVSSENFEDLLLMKINSNGEEEWTQIYGGSGHEQGNSVKETNDGGYIISGERFYTTGELQLPNSDVLIIKTDENGEEEWTQKFGEDETSKGRSIEKTTDGGYIVIGVTSVSGDPYWYVYLIKINQSGIEEWSQIFGGETSEFGHSVDQTNDGGYIITGWKLTTLELGNGQEDMYLIKTDESGNEEWSQVFGGEVYDVGYSVQQTTDGGYIICGTSGTMEGNNNDVYLIKTGEDGIEEWSNTYDGSGGDDKGYSGQQTIDGGYIICGYSNTINGKDVYLIKTDGQGNMTSTIELPTPTSKRELIKTTNILGQENTTIKNQPLIEIYDDGSTEKKIVIE